MSDFWEIQNKIVKNAKAINEVQNDKDFMQMIKFYLQKGDSEGINPSLVNFINGKSNKDNIIIYITYIIDNNPNNLSGDDLFQLGNLKKALVKNALTSIKESIEHNRIDFEIIGGYIEKKVLGIDGKLKKGWIPQFTTKTKQKKYSLGYSQIIPSDKGPNKFIVKLNTLYNRLSQLFYIEYNGGNIIHIFNKEWKFYQTVTIKNKPSRNNRDTNGYAEINTNNGKIVLFLDLYKKRQRYNNRNHKHHQNR